MGNLTGWTLVLLAGTLNCAGNLLLKQSRLQAGGSSLSELLLSPWFLGGLGCYGINVIVFAMALDRLPISVAYPVLAGLGFLLIAILAKWLFGETVAPIQWLGVGLILIGIILATRS